ncbi:MAG TPA: hypothetical protein VKJ45_23135 [Blastocatellia bacterium]|nr:hypothetical protein [Blastocatellia bacterium]
MVPPLYGLVNHLDIKFMPGQPRVIVRADHNTLEAGRLGPSRPVCDEVGRDFRELSAAGSGKGHGSHCSPPSAVHRHNSVLNCGGGGPGGRYSQQWLLFGVFWLDVRRTLLVALEQAGDPYAVMILTPEIIGFHYEPSARLKRSFGENT